MVHSIASQEGIDYICVQHEQAGAMAAESYSRITKNLGCAMATSGPGMTNLITGIGCAYFDSTPVLYITGQVNTNESKQGRGVRQIGFQETDIVEMVKPITKFAIQITNPKDIRYLLEKAVYIAKSGRNGPVLIDIPMDVQRAEINPAKLKKFNPSEIKIDLDSQVQVNKKIQEAIEFLKKAERPVVIVGGGIRYADKTQEFETLANILKVPVVATWSGIDVLHHDHPLYIGQIGVYGSRAANFTVQNSDCILSIGSRLDTRITGGKPQTFARGAKKIIVDIDRAEIFKNRGLEPDIAICADVRNFIPEFLKKIKRDLWKQKYQSWLKIAKTWKNNYSPIDASLLKKKDWVNPYIFIDTLSKHLSNNAVVITDCGGNLTWTIQAFHVKKGQLLFSAMGNSPMAYSLPASIGASFALGKKEVICIIGDGGFQMNIQELQTIKHYKLPIKVFILNSRSYAIIKQFQEQYFNSNFYGTQPDTGYSVPDFVKIAQAYGLKSIQIKTNGQLNKINKVLAEKGPVICDVLVPPDAKLQPKLEFGRPIEDLSPLLPRDEFKKNMFIPLYEE